MSAAAVERDLATNRRKQAEAQASAAAHHANAKASVDNPARFARASSRAANEERRLAIYHEEEAYLLEALPTAKRQDELEAHERAVATHEKEMRALAAEWRREYPRLAAPLAALCKRLDQSDSAGIALREAAKRLGEGASTPFETVEGLARPTRARSGGLACGGAIRGLINLPDFDGGRFLWGGFALTLNKKR